jgi:hypothetical protein
MKSRIYGVTKDILVIAFFVFLFFGLTHNPIVRPKAEPELTKGKWNIELRQRPLALGVAGHNYLVLRNTEGEIVAQFHGLPTDEETGEWKYVGRNKTDILHVWEFGPESKDSDLVSGYGITLSSGDKVKIMALWEEARICGTKINLLYLPYPPFGVSLRKDTENSNSVAYTLVNCMGLASKHIGLFTPGWGKNLLGSD